MTKSYDAFVYKWTCKSTGSQYIGYHVGHPDDGYKFSSDKLQKLYDKQPDNFEREILAIGNAEEMKAFETGYLRAVDAKNNEDYYNKHNNDDAYVLTAKSVCNNNMKTIEAVLEQIDTHKVRKKSFFRMWIGGETLNCASYKVSAEQGANLYLLIGKKIRVDATLVGDYWYFYPENVKEV
jgi:hypothetical protein